MEKFICKNCGEEIIDDWRSVKTKKSSPNPSFCSKHCCAVYGGRNVKNRNIEGFITYRKDKQKTLITTEKKWKCNVCGLTFRTRREKDKHSIEEHTYFERHTKQDHKKLCNCSFCKREFTTKESKTYHEKCCKENPNKIKAPFHFQTDEAKQKISKKMKELCENSNIWHVQGLKKRSYAEEYFYQVFQTLKIKPINNYHISRYWVDFGWPDKQIYFEVNGEQHYSKKGLEHDIERTQLLKEKGWMLIDALRWSEYCKLSKINQQAYIEELKLKIVNILLK
jgi:very-short-patch-repair endonuclease/rubredoxin